MSAQPRDTQERNKHHHAHAIIKQRLACDLGLQRLGGTETLEDPQDRDRVGGGDDRAEDQAVDEADLDADPAGDDVSEPADDERRGEDADGREQDDDRGLFLKVVEVDMQRPGKEQVTEHALHQRLVEVDRADECLSRGEHAHPRYDPINQQQGDCMQHGQQHQAYRCRQLEQFVVNECEGRCEGHEDAGNIEEIHSHYYP